MNSYPRPFIESVIKERIHEIYNSTNINRKKQKWLEYKKSVQKITLPYIQGFPERLRSSLRKFNITVCFKNNYSLDNFVTNKKDLEKTENSSNLIYLIKCKGCDKVYIGETDRRLKTRIVEHKRDCQVGNLNT